MIYPLTAPTNSWVVNVAGREPVRWRRPLQWWQWLWWRWMPTAQNIWRGHNSSCEIKHDDFTHQIFFLDTICGDIKIRWLLINQLCGLRTKVQALCPIVSSIKYHEDACVTTQIFNKYFSLLGYSFYGLWRVLSTWYAYVCNISKTVLLQLLYTFGSVHR